MSVVEFFSSLFPLQKFFTLLIGFDLYLGMRVLAEGS
jgi:hypothetical protein